MQPVYRHVNSFLRSKLKCCSPANPRDAGNGRWHQPDLRREKEIRIIFRARHQQLYIQSQSPVFVFEDSHRTRFTLQSSIMVSLKAVRESNSNLFSTYSSLVALFVGATNGIGESTLKQFAIQETDQRSTLSEEAKALLHGS